MLPDAIKSRLTRNGRRLDQIDEEAARVLPLRTPADVVTVIEQALNDARNDRTQGPQERARTIGMLASVALKAMEVSELAKDIEELKRRLDGEKQPQ
jgi:hypothetical protein